MLYESLEAKVKHRYGGKLFCVGLSIHDEPYLGEKERIPATSPILYIYIYMFCLCYIYLFIHLFIYAQFIINVSKTLILELPRKQNGRPIGYITLLTLIYPPKVILSHLHQCMKAYLWTATTMEKESEALMDVRHRKVRNRKGTKS